MRNKTSLTTFQCYRILINSAGRRAEKTAPFYIILVNIAVLAGSAKNVDEDEDNGNVGSADYYFFFFFMPNMFWNFVRAFVVGSCSFGYSLRRLRNSATSDYPICLFKKLLAPTK